jgi:hypothetical protein
MSFLPFCVRRYGMANVVPDRGMIGEFLVAYQDVMLEV